MTNFRDENLKIAKGLRGSLQYRDIRVGWLGKITAAGTVNPNPMDGLDLPYIWVRFEESGEAVRAINLKVDSRLANVRVRVGLDRITGELEILGLAAEAARELGEIAGTLNVPSRISDLITELVDPLRIKPLRVRPGDSAFDVYVEGGYYWYNGELRGWTGDFINIASSVPGGINTKRPVLIGIDPATDTLTSYDGDVVAMGTMPVRGKYFPQDVIAQTVNDADADIFWIACVPLTVNDTGWLDVLRVTALQFTGTGGLGLEDRKVAVTGADTTPGYLQDKIAAGNGIILTVLNSGLDEDLQIRASTGFIRTNNTLTATPRPFANFINGNGITITSGDDVGNTETELTFTVNQAQLSLGSLGTRSFLNLSDVPASFTSQALKIVRVNAAANALEFTAPNTAGHIIQDGVLTNYTQRTHLRFTDTTFATWIISDDGATDATELAINTLGQPFDWLSNVTVSGAVTEDGVFYNGSAWVNRQYWTPTRTLTQAAATTSVIDATLSHTLSANNAQIVYGYSGLGTLNQAGFNATASVGVAGVFGHGRATGASGTVTGGAGGVFLFSNTGAGTTTLGAGVYIKSGVRSAGTLTTLYGQYIESQTAGTNNYALYTNSGTVQLGDQLLVSGSNGGRTQFLLTFANGQSVDGFQVKSFSGTTLLRTGKGGGWFVSAIADTGGPEQVFKVTLPAHTALNASSEWVGVKFEGATLQWTNHATPVTQQRTYLFNAPTLTGMAGGATISDAATVVIEREPIQSTNMTLTRAWALWIQGGKTKFGGNIALNAVNIETDTTTGTQFGTSSSQKIALWGKTPIVRPSSLTTALTTLTFTAPGTPDYAIATVQLAGYGFSTADEGNTVLSVIANLQARVNGLETTLSNVGALP